MNNDTKPMPHNGSSGKATGLKRLTKANSIPVRLAKGGKELARDNSKKRGYKVAGEPK